MKFKNLNDYNYLIKQSYIKISSKKLTSLEGSPKNVYNGGFYCNDNKLESLKYSPEKINGKFNCKNNKNLNDAKSQILNYQIEAKYYVTDESFFTFNDISKEFNLIKEKNKLIQEKQTKIATQKTKIQETKSKSNFLNFDLGI